MGSKRVWGIDGRGLKRSRQKNYIRYQETLDSTGYDQKEEIHSADDKYDSFYLQNNKPQSNNMNCGLLIFSVYGFALSATS
jgi:hypothetical protein